MRIGMCLKRLHIKSLLYSHKSSFLLNYLTLKIADKEIEEKFTRHRLQSHNKLWWPYFILAVILFLWRIISLVLPTNGDPV